MSAVCAIVILNWNGKKILEQFLPLVIRYNNIEARVVVVDNNSTDDSPEFLQQNFPSVDVIRLSQNFGFAGGYNHALKQVSADYYVILNSDVEVTEGWLEPMIKLLEGDHSIAACQPKILSWHDKKMFEYAGAAGGWIDGYGYPFCRGRVFDTIEEDHGQYDDEGPVFWASGAALFIRSKVFHELKGFDEYFFAHQEEIDLCWRIQNRGYKVYVCPSSVVYHVGGGTLQKDNPRKTFLNFRNNLIMLARNLSGFQKIKVLVARFVLDQVTAWRGLLSGRGAYFLAVIRAQLAFLKWVLFHKDGFNESIEKKHHLNGWYPGNIVWEYFVRKKKRFSEIVTKTS